MKQIHLEILEKARDKYLELIASVENLDLDEAKLRLALSNAELGLCAYLMYNSHMGNPYSTILMEMDIMRVGDEAKLGKYPKHADSHEELISCLQLRINFIERILKAHDYDKLGKENAIPNKG